MIVSSENDIWSRKNRPFCRTSHVFLSPAVNWVNIARKHKDLQVGALLSLGITVTICLLWTIPMAFIASLSTVEGLREDIEFIDDMLDAAPFLVPVFEIAAPFFVIAVNSLLPIILEAVSLLEGPISGAVLEASLFVKLAAFMIIQTFFVSAISGSVIDVSAYGLCDATLDGAGLSCAFSLENLRDD